jgi:hypothetical protein
MQGTALGVSEEQKLDALAEVVEQYASGQRVGGGDGVKVALGMADEAIRVGAAVALHEAADGPGRSVIDAYQATAGLAPTRAASSVLSAEGETEEVIAASSEAVGHAGVAGNMKAPHLEEVEAERRARRLERLSRQGIARPTLQAELERLRASATSARELAGATPSLRDLIDHAADIPEVHGEVARKLADTSSEEG